MRVLCYAVPASMSISLLYVATLILTSWIMFFHLSEYRCLPNILLKNRKTGPV